MTINLYNHIIILMPKSFRYRHQAGVAPIFLILPIVVVIAIIGVLIFAKGTVKLPGKSASAPTGSSEEAQVELKTEYQNPFDKSTQYENPFSEYQNPFDQLK